MNCFDLESGKVPGVESENPADAMDGHERHKPHVVHLRTPDGMKGDEAFPFPVTCWRVRQEGKHSLDFANFTQCKRRRESQAVGGDRPSHYVPEFRNVLQREIDLFAGGEQPGDAVDCENMMRVVGLYAAQQDFGINQNAHLAASVIEAFTTDGLVRKRRRVRHTLGRFPPHQSSFGRRQ